MCSHWRLSNASGSPDTWPRCSIPAPCSPRWARGPWRWSAGVTTTPCSSSWPPSTTSRPTPRCWPSGDSWPRWAEGAPCRWGRWPSSPTPVAGLAIDGCLASRDGRILLRRSLRGPASEPAALGRRLAGVLLDDCGGRSLDDWAETPAEPRADDDRLPGGGGPGGSRVCSPGGAPSSWAKQTWSCSTGWWTRGCSTWHRRGRCASTWASGPVSSGIRTRSTRCSSSTPDRAAPSSGSREVTPSCSGAAARRRKLCSPPASPSRSSPASPPPSPRRHAAGVPVTHRGLSSSVTVVSGHVGDPGAPGAVDWASLARTGGTFVVLMGMAARAEIARRLIEAGRDPDTPVLVVHRGTTSTQASARTTLAGLAEVDLGPPCTIVIGPVAALDLLDPTPRSPGRAPGGRHPGPGPGRCPRGGSRRGRGLGDRAPGDRHRRSPDGGAALRTEAEHARTYDWIVFTSANAVDRFVGLLRDGRALGRARLAVVGAATARALARHHLVADLVAEEETAEGLVAAMPAAPSGEGRPGRVLFPRAVGARDVVAPGLRRQGLGGDRGRRVPHRGRGRRDRASETTSSTPPRAPTSSPSPLRPP